MSTAITPRRRHTLKDIYHENTQFDFVHRVWRWGLLSGVLVVFAIGGLLLRGLDLSLEFTGGTSWQVTMANGKAPSIGDIRTLVENAGLTNPDVTIVGGNQIRVQAKVANSDSKNDAAKAKADAIKLKIQQVLAGYAGSTVEQVSFSDVGGSWGSDVSQKAIQALIAFFIIIALYLSLRFEFKMAVAALIAVVHDILIVAGAYAWTQFQVSPGTVIAFLTILGFSLYDTVVVFDKIRENAATLGSNRTDSYSRMVNTSVNSVLMRSLNTSFLARPVRRSARRCLLVDLRRGADPDRVEGERAALPLDVGTFHDRARPRRGRAVREDQGRRVAPGAGWCGAHPQPR
jgi:preprotein translocase subunit SecF